MARPLKTVSLPDSSLSARVHLADTLYRVSTQGIRGAYYLRGAVAADGRGSALSAQAAARAPLQPLTNTSCNTTPKTHCMLFPQTTTGTLDWHPLQSAYVQHSTFNSHKVPQKGQ